MDRVTEAAPAKVNLFLHVTGRRPDGYHLLDSLVVFGPAADTVTATAADALSCTVDGPEASALAEEADNLVLRAARRLAVVAGVAPRAALTLTKRLPVAAGVGGGSADAAAALRALNRLWGVGLDEAALTALALPLGADVPACVWSRPVRLGGIGEHLAAAPGLPSCALLLVNPRVALLTPAVFAARGGPFSAPAVLPAVGWSDVGALAATLAGCGNDLEAAAIGLRPVIGEVLERLRHAPGCLLARMSGSGATCFGLFAETAAAHAVEARLPAAWWRAAGSPVTQAGDML